MMFKTFPGVFLNEWIQKPNNSEQKTVKETIDCKSFQSEAIKVTDCGVQFPATYG